MTSAQLVTQRYDVQVGHWHVEVICSSASEAIAQARKLLCRDMPRLWDVVMQLADERFSVRSIT